MQFHFSAYGFLKNQRYFEPFLYLAFLDKGLTFFQIGLLIGFREITLNGFEVLSGILADVFSRRRLLQASFASYACSFLILALGTSYWMFWPAMFFFAIADSFRTGTHKAMIFKWLQNQGRTKERTRFYGFTRSWSKLGSAFSVIVGSGLVLYFNDYTMIFLASIPPCFLGIINISFYSADLEDSQTTKSSAPIRTHLKQTWEILKHEHKLKGLLLEAAGFEGVFLTLKDYLQPLLKTAAVVWFARILSLPISDTQASVILVGPVYFFLFLGSAIASRLTYRFQNLYGSETSACHALWVIVFWLYLAMLFGFFYMPIISMIVFICMHIIQNLWRPLLISRFDEVGTSSQGATLLSLESQSRRITVILAAPTLGWIIDYLSKGFSQQVLWPLAVFGAAVTLVFLTFYWRNQRTPEGKLGL